MREAVWEAAFASLNPAGAAGLLLTVLGDLARGGVGGRVGYLALVRLAERSPTARLHLELATRQDPTLASLLAEGNPRLVATEDELVGPPLKLDREVTLGERRAWARRPDRNLLDRLLHDPDPVVIRNVLQNPRTVESDVLRVASKRPANAAVLAEVFHHPRWGGRPEVQLALVLNPYTPVLMAAGLVALLDAARLRDIVRDPGAHAAVRSRAGAALEWRMGRSPEAVELEDPDAERDPAE